MDNVFRKFLTEVQPIKFREPLAETLGAVEMGSAIEYSFIGAVKMAGHACPTVAGAYITCLKSLEKLYPGELPKRGEIAITIHGEPEEGVYGVIGQVFSFLTGAAPATGFKGLGYKFKRKDLLKYQSSNGDQDSLSFEFQRLDNHKTVRVRFYPGLVPFPQEKSDRLGQLIQKVVWEAAKAEEKREFQDLWMEKVKLMLIDRKDIERWLTVE